MAQANRLRPLTEGELPQDFLAGYPDPNAAIPPAPPQPAPPSRTERAATSMLLVGLRTLSQRALIAFANLFTLITVGSAWFLWWVTMMPDPSLHQLAGLTLYGALVLTANWLVLRRR